MGKVDWSMWVNMSFFLKWFQNWNQKINVSLLLVAETDKIESTQTCNWFAATFLSSIWVVEIANRSEKESDTEVEQNDKNNF